jgi:leucyl-tRNA synthetase
MILDHVEIGIQMNGVLKSRVMIPSDASSEEVQAIVLADEATKRQMESKTLVKFIYIKGRLANLVVK